MKITRWRELTPIPSEKNCKECGKLKPIANFVVSSYLTENGRRSKKANPRCRQCESIIWKAKHPTTQRATSCDPNKPKVCNGCLVLKSPDRFPTLVRKTKAGIESERLKSRCSECELARFRESRAKNPIPFRAYERKYRQNHKEKSVQASKRWYEANKEHIRERNRLFRKSHPEIVRPRYIAAIYKKRTLCDKRSIEVQKAIEECLESYRIGNQYWDVYNSELIDIPTIDHIKPVSRGGENKAENFCVTSPRNNSSKNNLPLIVWMARQRKRQERVA